MPHLTIKEELSLLFKSVKQTKAYAEIVDQICNLIEQGDLKPGDKLPSERTLSTELNIGRQSLREALSVLEVMGLLEVRHGIGTFVKNDAISNLISMNKENGPLMNPFELLEARKVIEVEIMGLAAKRATSQEIDSMEEALLALQSNAIDSIHEFELDRQLHLAFAKGAHNEFLYRTMTDMIEQMSKHLWISMKEKSLKTVGRADKYHGEHEEILKAIKNHDAKQAAQAMSKHLKSIEADFLQK